MNGPVLESLSATRVRSDGRELIYFGGCDYLGLAHDDRVIEALCDGARACGISPGASRTTSGNLREHELLEKELVRHSGFEAALVIGEGALANLALCEALGRGASRFFMDEATHTTGVRAARAAGFELNAFAHGDVSAFRHLVSARSGEPFVAWTDGVHPARGTLAPVAELLAALPPEGAHLVVDDAHGFGVLGARGLGACERFDVRDPRAVVTLTLSKAIGCYGGAVLGSAALIDELRRSTTYVGTTPVPASIARAARVALELTLDAPELRERLHANAARMTEHLLAQGRIRHAPPLPVYLLKPDSSAHGVEWHASLQSAGFHVPLVDYPGDGGLGLRLVVNAAHTAEEIDALALHLRS